jgi:hypothetical protein
MQTAGIFLKKCRGNRSGGTETITSNRLLPHVTAAAAQRVPAHDDRHHRYPVAAL